MQDAERLLTSDLILHLAKDGSRSFFSYF